MNISHPIEGWALEIKKQLWALREEYQLRSESFPDWDDAYVVAWPDSLLCVGIHDGLPAVCPGTTAMLFDHERATELSNTVRNGHFRYPILYRPADFYRLKLAQVEQMLQPFIYTPNTDQP